MPASSPWIDQWAPAQWTLGHQTADDTGAAVSVNGQAGAFDTTVHLKLAGAVIIGLVIIFALQAMDFRFVVAGNASVGIGG